MVCGVILSAKQFNKLRNYFGQNPGVFLVEKCVYMQKHIKIY